MKGLDKLLKSEAFKNTMEQIYKIKDYTVDDYRGLVDSLAGVERYDGYEGEVISLVNDMIFSYRMKNISFDELMFLYFRLSSSFVMVIEKF